MRETDHHVLQAMVADKTGEEAAARPLPDDKDDTGAASIDLSSVDLFASQDVAAPGKAKEAALSPLSPGVLTASGASASGYSIQDLVLFRALTGYRFETRTPIWRAVDNDGNRVPTSDRLFTTLAEEAFRFADRQRRLGGQTNADLTLDDLAMTLSSIRRAANAIGARGQIAFERLETAILGAREKARAETLPEISGFAAMADETSPAA